MKITTQILGISHVNFRKKKKFVKTIFFQTKINFFVQLNKCQMRHAKYYEVVMEKNQSLKFLLRIFFIWVKQKKKLQNYFSGIDVS